MTTFTRANGQVIGVEYEVESHGESNFDYPGHICDGGGSGPVLYITEAWPEDAFHNWIASMWNRCADRDLRPEQRLFKALMKLDAWLRCRLTDDEREQFEGELSANYEPDYSDDWYDLER